MADTFSKQERSEIMRKVKSSRNKSTELALISFFKSVGIIGWRRNYKIFGKPDFVFLKSKTAVFVDGCFWHGHDCRNTKPKTNGEYWIQKIERNKRRDENVDAYFKRRGWSVIRIWECSLKSSEYLQDIFYGVT